MSFSPRTQQAALGALLLAFGFVCGLLIGGHNGRPHQPPPRHPHHGPPDRHADQAVGMSFRSDSGGTTVIVLRDGQPVSVDQVGPVPGGEFGPPPQAPEQRNEQSGLWLALLGLSALAPITWAAMAWARRPGQAEIVGPDPNFVDGFVPRRDD